MHVTHKHQYYCCRSSSIITQVDFKFYYFVLKLVYSRGKYFFSIDGDTK